MNAINSNQYEQATVCPLKNGIVYFLIFHYVINDKIVTLIKLFPHAAHEHDIVKIQHYCFHTILNSKNLLCILINTSYRVDLTLYHAGAENSCFICNMPPMQELLADCNNASENLAFSKPFYAAQTGGGEQ